MKAIFKTLILSFSKILKRKPKQINIDEIYAEVKKNYGSTLKNLGND